MTRRILIGVDSSDGASAVVEHALWLAKRLRLTPLIAHVTDDAPILPHAGVAQRERARQSISRRSEQVLSRLDDRVAHSERKVLFGDPVDALEEFAEEIDAALVVVGSRGRGPVKSALLGSVSRALATRSSRPVLVVPPAAGRGRRAGGQAERAIICGVDGSEHGDRAVKAAAALARAGDLRLVVMHAEGLPASPVPLRTAGVAAPINYHDDLVERLRSESLRILERAEHLAGNGGLEVVVHLEVGAASGLLASAAEEEDAAFIVVGSRGRGALRSAVLGSTSAQLVGVSSRPVLFVGPAARV